MKWYLQATNKERNSVFQIIIYVTVRPVSFVEHLKGQTIVQCAHLNDGAVIAKKNSFFNNGDVSHNTCLLVTLASVLDGGSHHQLEAVGDRHYG